MIRFDSKDTTQSSAKILKGIFILLIVLLIGTVGYMLIERWTFLESI